MSIRKIVKFIFSPFIFIKPDTSGLHRSIRWWRSGIRVWKIDPDGSTFTSTRESVAFGEWEVIKWQL